MVGPVAPKYEWKAVNTPHLAPDLSDLSPALERLQIANWEVFQVHYREDSRMQGEMIVPYHYFRVILRREIL